MSTQAPGSNLLALAQAIGDPGFDEWFRRRLGQSGLSQTGIYTPQSVFADLLGKLKRAYQNWEKMPDYPVPAPARTGMRSDGKGGTRIYTPYQVVQIALWFWRKHVRGTEDHFTLLGIQRLFGVGSEGLAALIEKGLPVEQQEVSRDAFAAFLRDHLQLKEGK